MTLDAKTIDLDSAAEIDADTTAESTTKPALKTEQILVGDYSWNVSRMGSASAVCVLLHGTGASSHSWLPLMEELAPHFTVVSFDLPGHANTRCNVKADLSLHGMAKAVNELLLALKLDTHIVIGHSAGAAIAAQLLLNTPDMFKRMVSINGALVPLGGLPGLIFPPVARISASFPLLTDLFSSRLRDPKAVDKLLMNTGSHISKASAKQYHALCNNSAHVNGALQMMASWRLESLYPRLASISTPVQLIAAEKDAMIPKKDAYRLNRVFQNSELTMLPNLGHLAHEEQPALVADIILKGDL